MLYVVYSDINHFSQKKSHGQCQSYLQLSRGGAEAEKEEETWRGSYCYTQGWVQKNLPTSYSFFPDKGTTTPTYEYFIKA